MKVCFPVQQDQGMESAVFNHFGSAPLFVVVDTETGQAAAIVNENQHHAKGACNPIQAIGHAQIDAVVVGGIGAGALTKLNGLGIKVYRAEQPLVRENIALLQSHKLAEYALQGTCGGHGHGGACAH
jgi:predicted Fe-Mo cluster-binding NifX family protein